MKFYVAVKR